MNHMEYKGYPALIEYSAEDECFVGHVVGITDRIAFDGQSIAELRDNFHEVLDTYLKHCKKIGKAPEQPKSGKMSLRLPAELHAIVAQQSELTGVSVNQMVINALTETYLTRTPTANQPARRGRERRKETAKAK